MRDLRNPRIFVQSVILSFVLFSVMAHAQLAAAHPGYIPITLNNPQNLPTPVPFQQMINLSAGTYGLPSSFQNVEFIYPNGSVIPSWLESSNGGTGTFWVKLSSSIPANSNALIYAEIQSPDTSLFNGNTVGEAPWVSGTPNSYDNGQNVFNLYGYFGGNYIPANWSAVNIISESTNGLQLTSNGISYDMGMAVYNIPFTARNQIIELSGRYFGTSSTLADNIGIGLYSSGYNGLSFVHNANGNSGCVNPAPVQGYYIAYQFYPYPVSDAANRPGILYDSPHSAMCTTSGYQIENVSYASSDILPQGGDNYIFTKTVFTSNHISMGFVNGSTSPYTPVYEGIRNILSYTSPNSLPVPNSTFYVAGSDGSAFSNIYLYWVRSRTYPLYGVMPTSIDGSLSVPLQVSQPSPNSTVYPGSSASLSSSASGGIVPYTYQWIAEGPGSSSFAASEGNVLCGASSNTPKCTFDTSQSTAPGKYLFELQVTDSAPDSNTVISPPANVTVMAPFTIMITNLTNVTTNQPDKRITPVNEITIDQGYGINISDVTTLGTGYSYKWYAKGPGQAGFTHTEAEALCIAPQSSVCAFNTNALVPTGIYVFELGASLPPVISSSPILSNNVVVTLNSALSTSPTTTNTPVVDQGQQIYFTSNLPYTGTPPYEYYSEIAPQGELYSTIAPSASGCPSYSSGSANTVIVCTLNSPEIIPTQAGESVPSFAISTGNYMFRIEVEDGSAKIPSVISHALVSSAPANILVHPAPSITLSSNSAMDLGQSLSLTIAMGSGGAGPFTVNLVNLGSGSVMQSNTVYQGNTLTYAFTPASAGTYLFRASATDTGTSVPYTFNSSTVSVVVYNNPNVSVDEPTSQIDSGQPITLIAVARNGTGKFSYQWYNGLPTPSNQIAGAESPFFYAPSNSAGVLYYSVVATDTGTTVTPYSFSSSNAVVAINPAPDISLVPKTSTISSGGTQLLSISSSGGTGNFIYGWLNETGTQSVIDNSGSTYLFTGSNAGTFTYGAVLRDIGTEASIPAGNANTLGSFTLKTFNNDYVWSAANNLYAPAEKYGNWSATPQGCAIYGYPQSYASYYSPFAAWNGICAGPVGNAYGNLGGSQNFNTLRLTSSNTLLTSFLGTYPANAIGNSITFVYRNGMWDMNPAAISYNASNAIGINAQMGMSSYGSNAYIDYWQGALSFNGMPSQSNLEYGILLQYRYLNLPAAESTNVMAQYPYAVYDSNTSMWLVEEAAYFLQPRTTSSSYYNLPFVIGEPLTVPELTSNPASITVQQNTTPPPGCGNCGGSSGGGGGNSYNGPIVERFTNSTDTGYYIINDTQFWLLNLHLDGNAFQIVQGFISPTDAEPVVNSKSYVLNIGEHSLLYTVPNGTDYYIKLMNVSYLPILHTVGLALYRPLPINTGTTSTNSTKKESNNTNESHQGPGIVLTIKNSTITAYTSGKDKVEILADGKPIANGTGSATYNGNTLLPGSYKITAWDSYTDEFSNQTVFVRSKYSPILEFIHECTNQTFDNQSCTTTARLVSSDGSLKAGLFLNNKLVGVTNGTINDTESNLGAYTYVFATSGDANYTNASITYTYIISNSTGPKPAPVKNTLTPSMIAVIIAIAAAAAIGGTRRFR